LFAIHFIFFGVLKFFLTVLFFFLDAGEPVSGIMDWLFKQAPVVVVAMLWNYSQWKTIEGQRKTYVSVIEKKDTEIGVLHKELEVIRNDDKSLIKEVYGTLGVVREKLNKL
jgi:hypothetical protein